MTSLKNIRTYVYMKRIPSILYPYYKWLSVVDTLLFSKLLYFYGNFTLKSHSFTVTLGSFNVA